MKLQLAPATVADIAARIGSDHNDLHHHAVAIFDQFRAIGHGILTCRDYRAIYEATGGDIDADWYAAMRGVMDVRCEPDRRGYYRLVEVDEETSVAPAKKEEKVIVAKPSEPTLTGTWLEEQVQFHALDRKVAALLKRKRPEESFEEILSDVHLWFAVWADKGWCDEYISSGRAPTPSILSIWVDHKSTQRTYRAGKDALQRHMRGARTQYEIRHRRDLEDEGFVHKDSIKVAPNAPKVVSRNHDDDGTGHLNIDFWQAESAPPISDDEKSLVKDIIRAMRSRASDRYARYFDHLIEGRSRDEVAEMEDDSPLRVSHLFQRIRDDMRRAPDVLELSLKVLSAIADEPFSDERELLETVEDTRKLKLALRLLMFRGLVKEGSGKTYAPTDAGHSAVEMGEIF